MTTKDKVFLGGTCAGSTWRTSLMKWLQVDYFNPVVEDWTPKCKAIEDEEKDIHCNIHLYVITSEMEGVYSIAEMVQSSLTKGKVTIVHIIPTGFTNKQLRSLEATLDLLKSNGAICYIDVELMRTARVINYSFVKVAIPLG